MHSRFRQQPHTNLLRTYILVPHRIFSRHSTMNVQLKPTESTVSANDLMHNGKTSCNNAGGWKVSSALIANGMPAWRSNNDLASAVLVHTNSIPSAHNARMLTEHR